MRAREAFPRGTVRGGKKKERKAARSQHGTASVTREADGEKKWGLSKEAAVLVLWKGRANGLKRKELTKRRVEASGVGGVKSQANGTEMLP